jgi:hypothetical protein
MMIYLIALLLAADVRTSGWMARSVPPSDSEERICANWSDESWVVSGGQGQLAISKHTIDNDWDKLPSFLKPKRQKQLRQMIDNFTAIEVQNGYLIGNNIGEWGGWVYWYSNNGKKHYKILEGNPIGFAEVDDSVAVVEGLGHLGGREGSVHYLRMSSEGRWYAWKTVDLNDVPYAFLADTDTSIVIVTSNGLVRVTDTGVRPLADAIYEFLYPNSLAAIGGKYYVGMRYAVSELTPSADGYTEQWLVPDDCPKLAKVPAGGECRCVDPPHE